MKLKVKFLDWSAGIPVAMLNEHTALSLGVHAKERVSIQKTVNGHKEFSTIVDLSDKLVKKNELFVSEEIQKLLNLKKGEIVEVVLAPMPQSLAFIKKKVLNRTLSKKEIFEIIHDITANSLSEAEIALFVSGVYESGMNFKETIHLIEAIVHEGKTLDFGENMVVDKHSIGGVAGNRTTPIVVSICAAAGLIFPKTSSRAITSAAGTADIIETLARVDFSLPELKKIVHSTNACMVWGGALNLAPADDKLIQVEKALGLDPEAQLLASIMAKKISVGSTHILIDIPCGEFAKVSREKALGLKKKFEKIGKYFKKKLICVITDGNHPIGRGVGPVLEMNDVLSVLKSDPDCPKDLKEKGIFLAGKILELTDRSKKDQGEILARRILDSGLAFEKFKEIITAQKGKIKNLGQAKYKKDVTAKKSGKITKMKNKDINSLGRILGSPLDKRAGVYLHKNFGDLIKKREVLMTFYSESLPRINQAIAFFNSQDIVKIE